MLGRSRTASLSLLWKAGYQGFIIPGELRGQGTNWPMALPFFKWRSEEAAEEAQPGSSKTLQKEVRKFFRLDITGSSHI